MTNEINKHRGVYSRKYGIPGQIPRPSFPARDTGSNPRWGCLGLGPRLLSTIKDWDQLHQRHFCVVFARLLCSAGITNENEFHNSSSPTLVHPITSLPATPTHSVRKYGFFSEPTWRRQVAKYGNLKRCESLSFSGDIESLEPSKF